MIKKNIVPLSHMIGYGFQNKITVDKNATNQQIKEEYREYLKEREFYNDFKNVIGWIGSFGNVIFPIFLNGFVNEYFLNRRIAMSLKPQVGKVIKGMIGGSQKKGSWLPYALGGSWLALGTVPHLIDGYNNYISPAVDMMQYL